MNDYNTFSIASGLFSVISRTLVGWRWGSYPSAEMQLVHSTAPVDWDGKNLDNKILQRNHYNNNNNNQIEWIVRSYLTLSLFLSLPLSLSLCLLASNCFLCPHGADIMAIIVLFLQFAFIEILQWGIVASWLKC